MPNPAVTGRDRCSDRHGIAHGAAWCRSGDRSTAARTARLASASQRCVILGGKGAPERAGGEGGIRTHGRLAPTEVFKTSALNHSATSPNRFAPPFRYRRKIGAKTLVYLNEYPVFSATWLGRHFKFQDRCLKPLGHPSGLGISVA
jgi:hypothetical protein